MTPHQVLRELEGLAHRLGIVVRYEPFDLRVIEGRGGLCWFRGVPTVMIDVGLPLYDKIGVLVDALAEFDVEPMYVPPIFRQLRLARAGTRPPRQVGNTK